jgi:LPXTG-motif cell wall-anchored protein
MKIFKLSLFLIAFLFAQGVFAQAQQIFSVEIQLNYSQAKIGEVVNAQGYPSEPEKELEMGPNQYWLQLISSAGQTLDLRKISLDPRVSPRPPYPGEDPEPAGNIQADTFSKIIYLPFYQDAKLLLLFDANKNLLDQKDVSYLIPGCGDGTCGDKENYLSCASDCPAGGKDGWCNKGLVSIDPDCPKTEPAAAVQSAEQKAPEKPSLWLAIGGLAILLVISGLIFYIYRKRKAGNSAIGADQFKQ